MFTVAGEQPKTFTHAPIDAAGAIGLLESAGATTDASTELPPRAPGIAAPARPRRRRGSDLAR